MADCSMFFRDAGQAPGLGFPQARIVGVVSLSSGCVSHWRMTPCQGKGTGESS